MGSLSQKQLDHFEEFGFLVVENVLHPKNIIDPVIEEYRAVLENLAEKLYKEGSISSKYEELEFGDRVTKIYSESFLYLRVL